MSNYWMISDRTINRGGGSFGTDRGDLTFWLSDGAGALDQLSSWEKSTQAKFTQALMDAVLDYQQGLKHLNGSSGKKATQ